MPEDLTLLALIAAATAAASFTIARTKITAPLRAWVTSHSQWFGNLVGCPYCVSHWLALAGTSVYRPDVADGPLVADFVLAWLATVAVSAAFIGIITRAIAPAPPPAPAGPEMAPRRRPVSVQP